MSHLLLFAVLSLGATGRLTRLITADTITASLRLRFSQLIGRSRPGTDQTRAHRRHTVAAEFVTCPWCVSVWIAPAVLALGWWPGHHGTATWWWFPAAALTIAWAVALLTSSLDRD